MPDKKDLVLNKNRPDARTAREFSELSGRIMRLAIRAIPRAEFLREITDALIKFSKCDLLQLEFYESGRYFLFEKTASSEIPARYDIKSLKNLDEGVEMLLEQESPGLAKICEYIIHDRFDPRQPFFTRNGSFWTDNPASEFNLCPRDRHGDERETVRLIEDYSLIVIVPFRIEEKGRGLLHLRTRNKKCLSKNDVENYENIAQTIGVSLVHRRTQVMLRERVKELTCLYGIARLVAQPEISLDEILQKTVELFPPAFLYPDVTVGRIILDGRQFVTEGFKESPHSLRGEIIVNDRKRGVVEVVYTEEKPIIDEGPFLKEERNLIDAVANELSLIIERRQAEEEQSKLQEQLRHADRLATIGQLAAGVAHEINEPLGNILGFAQLAQKSENLPEQVNGDINKIVQASLHAREIVRKLLIFSRQMSPKKVRVDLNRLVEDGLYFLSSRCAKNGIELIRQFEPDLPNIVVDPGQIDQVLVNLVVNAIQAMPDGGRMIIQTGKRDNQVCLVVEDTGAGMSGDILGKIFIPFFTTKDVDEGTGLGLAVVHGIVTSHKGSIDVTSEPGKGSRFEIRLPVGSFSDKEESSENVGNR
jgi:signal transduction histidine kinase